MSAVSFAMRPALLAAALALAGCAGGTGYGSAAGDYGAAPAGDRFAATLGGAQEVPPQPGAGTGTAEVTVDPSTMKLRYTVNYSGLSGPATAGHIHGPAPEGKNAGVAVPFASAAASPITGEATITAAQYADLKAGNWYVNLHTAKAPGGEIRGQLKPR